LPKKFIPNLFPIEQSSSRLEVDHRHGELKSLQQLTAKREEKKKSSLKQGRF
jgi:hypothetical protein